MKINKKEKKTKRKEKRWRGKEGGGGRGKAASYARTRERRNRALLRQRNSLISQVARAETADLFLPPFFFCLSLLLFFFLPHFSGAPILLLVVCCLFLFLLRDPCIFFPFFLFRFSDSKTFDCASKKKGRFWKVIYAFTFFWLLFFLLGFFACLYFVGCACAAISHSSRRGWGMGIIIIMGAGGWRGVLRIILVLPHVRPTKTVGDSG